LRRGEGQNRDIDRDELRAVDKALRAAGDVRTVLDVGSGNSRWLRHFQALHPGLVVELDISQDGLAEARGGVASDQALAGASSFVCADAGALPFASQSFDLVACLQLLPYVRKSGRIRALREMRRVSSRWVIVEYAHIEGASFLWQRARRRLGLEATFPRNHLTMPQVESELRMVGLGIRGFAPVGGAFSRSWVVLAEAPSAGWMSS
jgi:ubiquinone/menaquinone biosynthesis C-methylase UbiE